jgi:hypothetical protein
MSYHYSTCLSSIFSISFHYSTYFLPYFPYLLGQIWKTGKLNSEKIWKMWKKPKLNSEKTWKIQKKKKGKLKSEWKDMANTIWKKGRSNCEKDM